MKVIQELAAYFERRQKLKPAQIEKLARQGFLASDGPANLMGLCNEVGQIHYFRVLGADTGSVWGTDVYTADSALSSAAVHAGAVPLGESQVVRVTVVEPLKQYQGSTRNDITTHSFGPFGSAFRVERL
jgi:hypothetical protein